MNARLHERFRGFRARLGVSRWDITPGLDVSAKNWGAAKHWYAQGVHQRLTGTALAMAAGDGNGPPLLLLSLDLGWWRRRRDAAALCAQVRDQLALPEASVIVHLTHTHAGPVLDSEAPAEANPAACRDYLARLTASCVRGGREALANLEPATALFHHGHCALATQRDLPDPANPERFLTGFNPAGVADETLLTARLFADDGRTLATLVNYACHPTTLAWENTLISPDYPGAMRELIESQTGGGPCLFLQGASGELAPAEQYSGDPQLADRHGRELGHAALATLAPLAAGCSHLQYDGPLESGAPLALWHACRPPANPSLRTASLALDFDLKSDLPTLAQIDAALAEKPDGFRYERLLRQRGVRASVGDGHTSRERIWLWRLGDAALCATSFETYSNFQTHLRAAFPNTPLLVLNLSNGSAGYLPPTPLYDLNLYTVWQTPFARGGHERLLGAAVAGLRELFQLPART
ncbi:MAG: neutral/alkaline non-lysosomal ceramidase N-terminal domain-containing protein [Verrucomicrobia bacterium]|nr:neutral/alkaline non-lysosomal ceramidase N-terminal domain-containing protein [Verrucomicrobiota bacterium]